MNAYPRYGPCGAAHGDAAASEEKCDTCKGQQIHFQYLETTFNFLSFLKKNYVWITYFSHTFLTQWKVIDVVGASFVLKKVMPPTDERLAKGI